MGSISLAALAGSVGVAGTPGAAGGGVSTAGGVSGSGAVDGPGSRLRAAAAVVPWHHACPARPPSIGTAIAIARNGLRTITTPWRCLAGETGRYVLGMVVGCLPSAPVQSLG